jgi:hypothetical protein
LEKSFLIAAGSNKGRGAGKHGSVIKQLNFSGLLNIAQIADSIGTQPKASGKSIASGPASVSSGRWITARRVQ